MEGNKTILFEVKLDVSNLEQSAKKAQENIDGLKTKIAALGENVDKNSIQYKSLNSEIE